MIYSVEDGKSSILHTLLFQVRMRSFRTAQSKSKQSCSTKPWTKQPAIPLVLKHMYFLLQLLMNVWRKKKSRLIGFEIWLGEYLICFHLCSDAMARKWYLCWYSYAIPLTSLPNVFYCKGVYMGNNSVYLKHQGKNIFRSIFLPPPSPFSHA